jgi:hypothetical protein
LARHVPLPEARISGHFVARIRPFEGHLFNVPYRSPLHIRPTQSSSLSSRGMNVLRLTDVGRDPGHVAR